MIHDWPIKLTSKLAYKPASLPVKTEKKEGKQKVKGQKIHLP